MMFFAAGATIIVLLNVVLAGKMGAGGDATARGGFDDELHALSASAISKPPVTARGSFVEMLRLIMFHRQLALQKAWAKSIAYTTLPLRIGDKKHVFKLLALSSD